MNEFYVYALLDTRKPHKPPFYIGKGKGVRANMHLLESQNKSHNNTIKINKVKAILNAGLEHEVHFIKKDLTEKQAMDFEVKIIAFYGRINNNTGVLANMTDGGDGQSGRRWTPEMKRKQSIRRKEIMKDPEVQKRVSEGQQRRWAKPEEREKMRKAAQNRPLTKKFLEARKTAGLKTKGRKHSPETIAKMKASWAKRKAEAES